MQYFAIKYFIILTKFHKALPTSRENIFERYFYDVLRKNISCFGLAFFSNELFDQQLLINALV